MATQITYTATYDNNGTEITKTRTSHRAYTHAAVYDYGKGDGPFIGSFHGDAANAAKGSISGIKPIAVVEAHPVTDAPAADVAPADAPVETKTTPQELSDRVDAAHAAAAAKKAAPKKTAKVAPKAKAAKTDAPATPSKADIEKAAAELAAEDGEKTDAPTNGHAVVEFFDHLINTDAVHATTGRNYRGIFRKVMVGGHARGLNADVTKINVENVWDRYAAATPTLLDSTAKVYRQYFLRAVKLFLDYTANPQEWTPTGRSEARRPRRAHQEFTLADGTTLRVTHTPGTDLKAALETALASLAAPAPADA
jgi:hypothetical protein